MKVVLNTAMQFSSIVVPSDNIDADYYAHPGHHKQVVLSPEVKTEWKRITKDEDVFDYGDYVFAGYTYLHNGVIYISSAGNMSWERAIKGATETEVGYVGRRHGMNISRVVKEECFNALREMDVVCYESSESDWFWHETRDDACLRLSGKTVRDWTRLSSSFRARQLACTDAPAAMRSWLVGLPDYVQDTDTDAA